MLCRDELKSQCVSRGAADLSSTGDARANRAITGAKGKGDVVYDCLSAALYLGLR